MFWLCWMSSFTLPVITWFNILMRVLFYILSFQGFFRSEKLHLFFFPSEAWMDKNVKKALDNYSWRFSKLKLSGFFYQGLNHQFLTFGRNFFSKSSTGKTYHVLVNERKTFVGFLGEGILKINIVFVLLGFLSFRRFLFWQPGQQFIRILISS